MRARSLLIVQVNQICEFPLFIGFKLKLILNLVLLSVVNIFIMYYRYIANVYKRKLKNKILR